MPSYIYQFCEVRMKKTKVYGTAELGYYSGTENGLTIAGTDGYLHHWSGGGTYTRECVPTAADRDAAYSEVSKAALYERITDLYSGFAGRYCVAEFRAAVADLRLHTGDLAATQWARLTSMDAEIERNHAELELGRAEEWLKTETFGSYCHELTSLRPRGLASALRWLYGPVGCDRRTLYETGGVEAVYEHDRAEKLAVVARYRAMLEKPALENAA
jgi:hypothetical protein